jgi:phosphatidate cytidylyltransferase
MTAAILDRNLASRVGTAAVALPALLAVFFLGPRVLGVGLIALACLVALHEFGALMAARGYAPFPAVGPVVLGLGFLEVVARGEGVPLLPLALVVTLSAALRAADNMPESITRAAIVLLGALYLGGLGGSMAGLLLFAPASEGPWRLVFLLAVIMTADTTAFFGGKLWGRRKLAPVISPGKTVEGGIAAFAGGIPAALLVRAWGLPDMPVAHAVLLGALISMLGLVGDLGESLLKRWAGVKDSGALFPGHGGMLDRLDSLIFAAPVLYYYFAWLST